ncbi:hypothetical protein VD0004_g3030 [Verticillium dahliae]|nr:hypothetical protein VD0004_g3030 [Verticillium dahliae]
MTMAHEPSGQAAGAPGSEFVSASPAPSWPHTQHHGMAAPSPLVFFLPSDGGRHEPRAIAGTHHSGRDSYNVSNLPHSWQRQQELPFVTAARASPDWVPSALAHQAVTRHDITSPSQSVSSFPADRLPRAHRSPSEWGAISAPVSGLLPASNSAYTAGSTQAIPATTALGPTDPCVPGRQPQPNHGRPQEPWPLKDEDQGRTVAHAHNHHFGHNHNHDHSHVGGTANRPLASDQSRPTSHYHYHGLPASPVVCPDWSMAVDNPTSWASSVESAAPHALQHVRPSLTRHGQRFASGSSSIIGDSSTPTALGLVTTRCQPAYPRPSPAVAPATLATGGEQPWSFSQFLQDQTDLLGLDQQIFRSQITDSLSIDESHGHPQHQLAHPTPSNTMTLISLDGTRLRDGVSIRRSEQQAATALGWSGSSLSSVEHVGHVPAHGPTFGPANPPVTNDNWGDDFPYMVKPEEAPLEYRDMHFRIALAPANDDDNDNDAAEDPDANHADKKPRGCFDDEKRKQTADTRRRKACVRCRTQRIRCVENPKDPHGDCMTCLSVDTTSRKTTRPVHCMRSKLTDIILYRPAGSLNYTQRWDGSRVTDVNDWDGPLIQHIDMMQDICPVGFPIRLEVRKFHPREGDRVHREWYTASKARRHEIAPYALANLSKTVQYFKDYVSEHAEKAWRQYWKRKGQDDIISRHYSEAMAHTHSLHLPPQERELLENVFKLWFATQITLGSSWISSEDKLGIMPETDPAYPQPNKAPTPKMVVAQFDRLNPIYVLRQLRAKVLKGLEKLTQSPRRESFFTVYMTIYILLHVVTLTCQDRHDYARRHNNRLRYDMPPFIENLQHGAVLMLCHWDYYKGRSNAKGEDKALTLEEILENGGVSPSQRTLILDSERRVTQLKAEGKIMTEDYENPYFWISQMFDKSWSPGQVWQAKHY